MRYRDYEIEHDGNHYKVIAPDGREWNEDTVTDAKETIDEEIGS